MLNYDSLPFRKYTYKTELDKAINTLKGLLKGISIDNIINPNEINELNKWLLHYSRYQKKHPFNEIIPVMLTALNDGALSNEECDNLIWLCNNLNTDSSYYNIITSDIRVLQGILHGIMADNVITKAEVVALNDWLEENQHLEGTYPYDEIYSVVKEVLADGVLTEEEKNLLKVIFSEFIDMKTSININIKEILKLKSEISINGICAMCPEIIIPGKVFCFTGGSSKTTRNIIKDTVESLDGIFKDSVTKQTNYLVIGNNGNPCWAFACYGRKVEKAVNLRRDGQAILIVHENDFWDSIEDFI